MHNMSQFALLSILRPQPHHIFYLFNTRLPAAGKALNCRHKWNEKFLWSAFLWNFSTHLSHFFSLSSSLSHSFGLLVFSSLSEPLVYLISLPRGNTALLFTPECRGKVGTETRSSPGLVCAATLCAPSGLRKLVSTDLASLDHVNPFLPLQKLCAVM